MIERMKAKQPKPVKLKPCKLCGGYGHTAWQCRKNPKKPMQAKKQLKAKTKLKPLGKIGTALQEQRKQYFIDHPQGIYECIYCLFMGLPTSLEQHEAQVEHGMSKTRHPALRFDKNNLYITCPGHNADKGSKDIDEYLEILKQKMEAESDKHFYT